MAGRERQVIAGLVLLLLWLLGVVALNRSDDSERISAEGAIVARAGVTTIVETAAAFAEPSTTTTSTAAPETPATTPAPSTTLRRPVATTVRAATPTTVRAQPASTSTSTTAPVSLTPAQASTTTTSSSTLPPTTTTSTTLDPCRNSTVASCGPFRFDPQPGADNPMTVEVTVQPASPVAGQPLVFHITLTDPDGVSYNGTTFNYGNGGVAGSTPNPCAKFGPWDPPARDPASAVKTQDMGHTYFEAGTYTATFLFDAGPFDCVDGVTGRGDRPYASTATGSVTVTVVAAS